MRRLMIPVLVLAGCTKPEPLATTKAETKHSEARQDGIVVIPPPAVRTQVGDEIHIVQQGYTVHIRVGTEIPQPPTRKLPLPSSQVVPPIPPPVVPPIPPAGPREVIPPSGPPLPLPSPLPGPSLPLPGGPVMLPGGPLLPGPSR